MENNIFSAKVDAAFYLFTYILFPTLTVIIGLNAITSEISLVYWYLTILCNAICCLHDCANRWGEEVSEKNSKLFRMGKYVFIIIIYTIVEIFFLLNNINFRFDYILLLYCINIFTSIRDVFTLFKSGTTMSPKRR